jgi:hypothetical protein
MVPESKLEKTEHGRLVPTGAGWYVLNLRDAEWRHADGRGAVSVVADDFEGRRRKSAQLGVNPFVLQALTLRTPNGQPCGLSPDQSHRLHEPWDATTP